MARLIGKLVAGYMVKQLVLAMVAFFARGALSNEYFLTGSGFSGVGLQPSTRVVPSGSFGFGYSPLVAGAAPNTGYSLTLAGGLGLGIEATTRLATQDLRCDLWVQCPTFIRDMSQSLKWAVPEDYLSPFGIRAALGVTDFGGAATYFRSHYLVTEKQWKLLQLRLGYSWKGAQATPLEGGFGALMYEPGNGFRAELQHSASLSSLHIGYSQLIARLGLRGAIAWNQRIGDSLLVPSNWWSFNLALPLDRTVPHDSEEPVVFRIVRAIEPTVLRAQLDDHGFQRASVYRSREGVWVIDAPNDHYRWNDSDAMAVLLRFAAAAWGDKPQPFKVRIMRHGIVLIQADGDAQCVRRWLSSGDLCPQLSFSRGFDESGSPGPGFGVDALRSVVMLPTRLELVVSPIVSTAIGTEVGSFDGHAGLSWNATLSLWTGAHADWNYNKASGWVSKNMRPDGILAQYGLKDQLSRRMLHQLIPMPWFSIVSRVSIGRGYGEWDGRHLESMWLSSNGMHRLGLIVGSFSGPPRLDPLFGLPIVGEENPRRSYRLLNYRIATPRAHNVSTELYAGTFWAGDEGYSVYQRFRFGDASLAAFFRRTKMPEAPREVSFAGIQLALPLTPRYSAGWKHFAMRGNESWSYAIESKVLENDNLLTSGYGEIPRFGEHLSRWMNQDRLSTDYFESQLPKMRQASSELTRF